MQIPGRIKTVEPNTPFEQALEQELLSFVKTLAELLNGGLKFSDNHNAVTVNTADTGTINTEFAVTHTLKRVPDGFIVTDINKAAVIYSSGTAWTVTTIYLKASVANCNVDVLIF